MYTTLETLKEVKACIPGYTRMVSFFSTHADMKSVPIPLYAIPLMGDADDCTWALDNGCFFDPVDYQKFYVYHLPNVVRNRFNSFLNDAGLEMGDQPTIVREALMAYFECKTDQQIVGWFEKYRLMRINHALWNDVFHNSIFGDPHNFVKQVLNDVGDTFDTNYKRAVLRLLWAQVDPVSFTSSGSPAKRRSMISRRIRDNDEEEDGDDYSDDSDADDDNEPHRRMSPDNRAREAIKNPILDEGPLPNEDKAARRYLLSRCTDSTLSNAFTRVGHSLRIFSWYRQKESRAYNMALALTCGEDPYQKMVTMMVAHNLAERAKVKGFMLSQANDNEPPGYHLTLNVSDPKMIFHVFHMLKATDLNVSEMFGVSSIATTVGDAISSLGLRGNSSALDRVTLVNEERMEVAERNDF